MEKGKKKEELAEQKELFAVLTLINKTRVILLFASFILIAILRLVFSIDIPSILLVIVFLLGVTILAYLYLLTRKGRTLVEIENLHLFYFTFHLLIYTLIIHTIGGVEWIGVVIYFFIVVEANILLSLKKGFLVTSIATLCYSGLVLLEYLGIVPHRKFFLSSENPYLDPLYVVLTVSSGAFFGFHYVGFLVGNFSKVFRKVSAALLKKSEELSQAYSQLEEAKGTLEIRVAARTKELQELADSLDRQVQERTKELQKRVDELEKFRKLTVGRELKMKALKEEMEGLKEKTK